MAGGAGRRSAAGHGGQAWHVRFACGMTAAQFTRNGLATAQAERVVAGGRAMEIARVRITDAGRRALAKDC